MLKVIQATSKFMPQFQGPIVFGNFQFEPNFLTNLENKRNASFINALIGRIFWKLDGVGPVDNRPFTDRGKVGKNPKPCFHKNPCFHQKSLNH